MTHEDDPAHRFLPRIRQELDKLPLTDAQKEAILPALLRQAAFIDTKGGRRPSGNLRTDSDLFDFARKMQAVVDHFPHGGLSVSDYLRAVLKQPQLFTQSSATIIAHIEAVTNHFRDQGLTIRDYLRAAVKHPALFVQSPPTTIANIQTVAEHFREQGLTLRDYLHAALKQPSHFSQAPATIISNVETVVDRFHAQGLTLRDYVQAALRRPALFGQAPATIIGHVNQIIDLHRHGLARFPGEDSAPADQPLRPLFAFLVKRPLYFSLASDNFTLREIAAQVTGDRPRGAALLRRSRHQVERELTKALGHPDQHVPVPRQPPPHEGGDARRHAHNVLLRALIREGIVRGTLER
jgi:hypothetical protein